MPKPVKTAILAGQRPGVWRMSVGISIEACAARAPKSPSPLCAFTVDVEDWYQSSVDFDAPISERVLRNCDRLLALLDRCGVKATFFVQGLVAEAFPGLVRTFLQEGHEVQSHGYSHRPLSAMNRATLQRELEFACKTIEERGTVERRPLDLAAGSYYSWPDRAAVERFRASGRRLW